MSEGLKERCERFRKDPKAFVAHTQGIISAIERENKLFHAFVQIARITTSQLEDHVERYKKRELFGSILAVKAVFSVKGFKKDAGFAPELERSSPEDAELVKKLRERGAFVIGVTNLDEACLHAVGENKLHGRMINPQDSERTVLGSSGGSALSVAKGWADFALGTDSGGSVRAPAAACGIAGVIARSAALPLLGCYSPAGDLDCAGIMAKSVSDLQYILAVLNLTKPQPASEVNTALLIPSSEKLICLSPDFRSQFLAATEKLGKSFPIRDLPLPFDEAVQARKTLITKYAADYFKKEGLDPRALTASSRAIVEFGNRVTESSLSEAKQIQTMLSQGLNILMEEGAMILTPTLPYPAPRWKEIDSDSSKALSNLGYFLSIVNLGGANAISFPIPNAKGVNFPSLHLIGSEISKILGVAERVLSALSA